MLKEQCGATEIEKHHNQQVISEEKCYQRRKELVMALKTEI
jgi:hypothetical protein